MKTLQIAMILLIVWVMILQLTVNNMLRFEASMVKTIAAPVDHRCMTGVEECTSDGHARFVRPCP